MIALFTLSPQFGGGMNLRTDSGGKKQRPVSMEEPSEKVTFTESGASFLHIHGGNAETEMKSRPSELFQKDRRLRLIQLTRQKPVHELDDRDIQSAFPQSPCSFQPEQTAPDHKCLLYDPATCQ